MKRIPWNKGLKGVMVAWNKGLKTGFVPRSAFKKGHKTWNEGTEGLCKPNSGSFKKGIHYNLGRKLSEELKRKKREPFLKILEKRLKDTKICEYCGKEFKRPLYARQGYWNKMKLCSIKCVNDRMRKEVVLSEYGREFDDVLKEQIRFRDGYKCRMCGCPQVENKKQLDCHHIDYIKKNNDISNLVALCKNCHGRTNYDRKKWIEYFNKEKELWVLQNF